MNPTLQDLIDYIHMKILNLRRMNHSTNTSKEHVVWQQCSKKGPGVTMDQKTEMHQEYETLCETGDNYSVLAHSGKSSTRPLWLN